MLPDMRIEEPPWTARACGILACAFILLFFFYHASLLVPAHPGTDQNGYICGGKMLYEHGSMAYSPININSNKLDPFLFVGRMWVGTELGTGSEKYYPKYPVGLPALYASVLKIFGFEKGRELIYWLSPICMTLSLIAIFLMVRMFSNSFMALLSIIVMSTSPLAMGLTTNPNSHATAVFCVAWGMYLLLGWWRGGGWARAAFGGFLLGFSTTIRYTEGALVLPLLLVIIFNWPKLKPRLRYYCESSVLLLSWALPVLVLLVHNLIVFRSPTGYDLTNESAGFAWEYFVDNWENMFRQIDGTTLFFFFPLGIAGLTAMFWWSWRIALVIASWILPCILIYTAYYWAPDGLGYARFFMTIIPGLVLCAFWLLSRLGNLEDLPAADERNGSVRRKQIASATAGLLAIFAVLVNLNTAVAETVDDSVKRTILYENTRDIMRIAKPKAVIISPENNLLHQLQFFTDFQLYSSEYFERAKVQKLPDMDPDEPQGLQPQRRQALYDRLKDFTQNQLTAEIRNIVSMALENGQEVYFIKREDKPMKIKDSKAKAGRESDILSAPPDSRNQAQTLPKWLIPQEIFDIRLVQAWQNQPPTEKDLKERKHPRGKKLTPTQQKEAQQRQNWVVLQVTLKEKQSQQNNSKP